LSFVKSTGRSSLQDENRELMLYTILDSGVDHWPHTC